MTPPSSPRTSRNSRTPNRTARTLTPPRRPSRPRNDDNVDATTPTASPGRPRHRSTMKTSRPSPGCGNATVSPRDHDCRQPPHARRDSSPRNNERNPIDERRLLPNPVPRMRPPRLRRTLDPTARASPPARAAPRTLHQCAAHSPDYDDSYVGDHRAHPVVPPSRRASRTLTANIPVAREKYSATTSPIAGGGPSRIGTRTYQSLLSVVSLHVGLHACPNSVSRLPTGAKQPLTAHRSHHSAELSGAADVPGLPLENRGIIVQ